VTQGNAIKELRRLAIRDRANRQPEPAAAEEERCDLCLSSIPADHRHLLHVEERRIVCTCETCRALFAGDGPYRPTGSRTVWLDGFQISDELWASFRIPIGLAFFFDSSMGGSDAHEPDAEALIVNRLGGARQHAIVPIDECYRLVGLVRVSWEGISGGAQIETAVAGFFAELQRKAA
jgi:hypothetical protein